MRTPNPPRILLRGLTEDETRAVVKTALLVVADLQYKPYDAYGALESAEEHWTLEMKLAFASLLDSQQAATVVSMREAAK